MGCSQSGCLGVEDTRPLDLQPLEFSAAGVDSAASASKGSHWFSDLKIFSVLECEGLNVDEVDKIVLMMPIDIKPGSILPCISGEPNNTLFVPPDGSLRPGQKVIVKVPKRAHPLPVVPSVEELIAKFNETRVVIVNHNIDVHRPVKNESTAAGLKDADFIAHEIKNGFESLVSEISSANFKSIEKFVQVSHCDNHPTISFLLDMALLIAKADPSQYNPRLKLMFLYLLKLIMNIVDSAGVDTTYSLIVSYTPLSFLSNSSVVESIFTMIPKKYRKQLAHLFILNSPGKALLFSKSMQCVSSKCVDKKVHCVDYISDIAVQIHNGTYSRVSIPYIYHEYIRLEDESRSVKATGILPSLDQSYDHKLGTTKLLYTCIEYLRKRGGLRHVGIFRIAGDESLLRLVKSRLQYGSIDDYTSDYRSAGIIDGTTYVQIGLNEGSVTTINGQSKFSRVVVKEIDSVAQIIKFSVRELSEPLITREVYQKLLSLTKKMNFAQCGDDGIMEWLHRVDALLHEMPLAHVNTLKHLLIFLHDISSCSSENQMTNANLAVVFAPTIMRTISMDQIESFNEMKLSQSIVQYLISYAQQYKDQLEIDNRVGE
jgi:hypothetical protein